MNESTAVITPEAEHHVSAAALTIEEASALVIQSNEDYELAGEFVRRIARLKKELNETRRSMTRPLDESKKRIMDLFRRPEQQLDEANTAASRKMLAWKQEQDRARREAEAAAAEAARKERERLEKQAAAAAKRGQQEKAAALSAAADSMPAAPVVHIPEATAAGVSTRQVWKYEIVDKAALPREFMTPDEKAIGAVVRARQGDTNIPGVRVYAEETLVKRA